MAAATAMMPATTNPLKRVKFCDDHLVEVFQMPYDFEVSRSLLFYSPQEILKFQDERFEEEAAALEQKRLEEAEARKAEKAEKKKQRKERLQAKREARKKKQEEPSSTESTPTASRSKSRRTKDTTDATIASRVPVISSDDDLMSSSSESEELTLPQELPQTPVKSPQRPFPNMDLDVQSPCARRHSFPKNIAALAEAVAKATEEVNEADASAGGARVVTPSPQKRAANKKQQKYRRSAQSDLSSVSCKLHLPLPNLSHSPPAPTSNSSLPNPDTTSLPRDRSPIRAQNHSITVNTIDEEPKEQENTPPGEDKGETVEDETENVMEPLLPRPSNNTASTTETTDTEAIALTVPPASSTTTVEDTYSQDVLQRNLQRWKQSTLFLFGLLVLSWIYFSFGASVTTTGSSGTTPPSPPPSLGLRASVAAASNTANPLLLDLKPTATVNQRR